MIFMAEFLLDDHTTVSVEHTRKLGTRLASMTSELELDRIQQNWLEIQPNRWLNVHKIVEISIKPEVTNGG